LSKTLMKKIKLARSAKATKKRKKLERLAKAKAKGDF